MKNTMNIQQKPIFEIQQQKENNSNLLTSMVPIRLVENDVLIKEIEHLGANKISGRFKFV